jgi:thiamine biosynthesis protein ThiC
LDIRFDYVTKDIKIVNNSNVNVESVNVYSILGQSVYSSNTLNSNNEISVTTSNITTGTYIVIVHTANGIKSKKILIN